MEPGTTPSYRTLAEVRRLVRAFEDGTLPLEAWNHAAHLTVAIWYMLHLDEARATGKLIDGIRAFNHRKGILQTPTGGYHETITLFWLAITRKFVDCRSPGTDTLVVVNDFLARYATRPKLFLEYFSRKRILSWHARLAWVEPDLRPLGE